MLDLGPYDLVVLSLALQRSLDADRKEAISNPDPNIRWVCRASGERRLQVLEKVAPEAADTYRNLYGVPMSWGVKDA